MISNISQPFFPGDISIIRSVSKESAVLGESLLCRKNARWSKWKKRYSMLKNNGANTYPCTCNISAGGIARYATNKDEAIKVLEFLASPAGSKGLAAQLLNIL